MKGPPNCDIGICSTCGWRGLLSGCDTEEDGDWETNYHEFPLCPVCKDGGCIDDYDYSLEELVKFNQWSWNKNEKDKIWDRRG